MDESLELPPRVPFWRRRPVRLLRNILLTILATALLFFAIHQGFLRLVAWIFPAYESFFYNLGVFGIYRTASYVTLDARVPLGNIERWDDSCRGGLVLLAPFGADVGQSSPMILDARGELVWVGQSNHTTATNVNVQQYDGKPYLTYWAGDKNGGAGSGEAFMLDSSYRVVKRLKGEGPELRTDLHEFVVTDDGHALLSTINSTTGDMSNAGWGHSKNDYIYDSVFQEIDIATGDLLFQWRASEHFNPADAFMVRMWSGYTSLSPYDFFHLNSIQRDSKGNYLISARHMHQIVYIDGQSGDVIWKLGGHPESNDFVDLSDGEATNFAWQHHARWLSEEEGLISVMANGLGGFFQQYAPYSRALIIKIDQGNRTAELIHEYTSLDKVLSPSQGSVQILPNDNVFVGWGPMAAWSEFKHSGELLCEYHFAASAFFWTQRVKNYRAFKVYNWTAEPDYPPVAKTKGGKVYVSWNGATEVRSWKLQLLHGADENGQEMYEHLETIEKRSFESVFEKPKGRAGSRYRVVALNEQEEEIGASEPATEVEGAGLSWIVVVLLFVLLSGTGLWLFRRYRTRRRQENGYGSWELGTWKSYRYSRL